MQELQNSGTIELGILWLLFFDEWVSYDFKAVKTDKEYEQRNKNMARF